MKKIFVFISQELLFFLILHKINFYLSKLLYQLKANKVNNAESKKVKENKYIFFNKEKKYSKNDEELISILDKISNFTSTYKKKDNITRYVIKKNFTYSMHSQSNQKHCDEVDDNLLLELKRVLLNSDIISLVESIYGCQYTVVNVRSWIFYPLKNKMDDHVHKHLDGFPSGIIKIMYYQGQFNLYPALEIESKNESIKIDGTCPILVFDPNIILHGAKAPIDLERPTIEITFMPRNFKKFNVQQSGFQAGYPLNPFRDTNIPIPMQSVLRS
jgi:hypothetical protein